MFSYCNPKKLLPITADYVPAFWLWLDRRTLSWEVKGEEEFCEASSYSDVLLIQRFVSEIVVSHLAIQIYIFFLIYLHLLEILYKKYFSPITRFEHRSAIVVFIYNNVFTYKKNNFLYIGEGVGVPR